MLHSFGLFGHRDLLLTFPAVMTRQWDVFYTENVLKLLHCVQ